MRIGFTPRLVLAGAFCLAALWAQEKTIDVRLTEKEARDTAILATKPEYPPIGRQLRLQGAVVSEVTVGVDGRVEKIDIISGHPLLVNSVRDALKKWKFPPKEIDGRHVILHFRIAFEFGL